MKKRLTAVILAAVLTISASFSAFAGIWDYSDGYWYFSDSSVEPDDEYLTGWQWIDGYCYYFDPDEGGAMAVMTVTPDGFPVNDYGRMTDAYGEPYYIPGWGLTATTVGPADYNYDDVYVSDYPTPLSSVWDLDFWDDLWGRRDREPEEPRRRTPDTVVIQVEINGAQPENPEGQPELPEELPELPAELPELPEIQPEEPVINAGEQPQDQVIRIGGGIRRPETAGEQSEEPVTETAEQEENQVIRAGGSTRQSSDTAETENSRTERPASRPQRSQGSSGASTSGTARNQGRPGNGNATGTGSRSGSDNPMQDLLYLLGLEAEQE